MVNTIETDIGKIFAWYDESKDEWFLMRYLGEQVDEDNKTSYVFRYMDDNFNLLDDDSKHPVGEVVDRDRFLEIKKNWVTLSSDGIVAISNIVSITNEDHSREIKDVIAILFPNNRNTGVPDARQPYVVARQGINDIFDVTDGTVGMSVSLDTLPNGYTLSDFMENDSVISSKMCHIYKTDTEFNLSIILDNDETNKILEDLYNHEVRFRYNTVFGYVHESKKDDCINGYCNSLKSFLFNSGFMDDTLMRLGISKIDFKLTENQPIVDDDLIVLSLLYGGIRINKAVPLKFAYDIDLDSIKMKYVLVMDRTDTLYIVYYTEFADEISAEAVYKITQERTNIIHERLQSCIEVYEQSLVENSNE